MNISIIGTGYVGLVSGACFASLGHHVICVDIDQTKVDTINQQKSPIYEKNLDTLLKKHHHNITATTSYPEAIQNTDITFICVGTPSKKNGDIDLTYINQAITTIATELKNKKTHHTIIIKSTVIPGTTQHHILPLIEKTSNKTVGTDIGLGMNPEFLREGVAIQDFLKPDRIINGYHDTHTKKQLHTLYKDFNAPIIETSLTVAEMIKYASNCFLATKISFINEIGNLCKHLNIDVYDVADGMGLDTRIQRSFLNAGIGWGGSCFPKDTQALTAWAKQHHLPHHLLQNTITVNNEQPLQLIKILKKHLPHLKNKKIGILGLAFKPDTDDIRDSRTIPLIHQLIKEHADIHAHDPKAIPNFKKLFPTITYHTNPQDILTCDAILLTTAWNQYTKLDYTGKLVIDGRRIPEAKKTAKTYEGVCW